MDQQERKKLRTEFARLLGSVIGRRLLDEREARRNQPREPRKEEQAESSAAKKKA